MQHQNSILYKALLQSGLDISVETVACLLVEAGLIDREAVEVLSKGQTGSPLSLDVSGIVENKTQRKIRIEAHRDGAYEYFPEAFLHPSLGEWEDQLDSHAIEQYSKEKQATRDFFNFFERHLSSAAINKEAGLRKIWWEPASLLARVWALPAFLEARERRLIHHFLLLQHQIMEDLSLCAICFGLILQQPVAIIPGTAKPMPSIAEIRPAVGRMRIGIDAFAGDQALPWQHSLKVNIGPVSCRQLATFLPGGRKRKLLEEVLYPLLLPVEYQIKTLVNSKDTGDPILPIRLGYSKFFNQ